MKSGLLLVCAALISVSAAQRPEPSPLDERMKLEPAALARIKQVAVPFRADIPTGAELAPLLQMSKDARVIGIGESTHGDFQSQAFKAHLIRELVRKERIDSLVFEINRDAGAKIDEYVNQGKGDIAEVVGNGGIFTIWRTDEVASLLGWLRAYVSRSGKQIRVYGVDCQDPAVDLALACTFLDRVDRRRAKSLRTTFGSLFQFENDKKTYYAWVKSQAKDSFKAFSTEIQAAQKAMSDNQAKWEKREGYGEARYAFQTAWQALHSFEFEFGPQQTNFNQVTPEQFGRRDRYMGENVMTRIGATGRAAIWAHDSHVLPEIPEAYAQMGAVTLGTTIRKQLGPKYFTIGFTWAQGAIHAKPINVNQPNILNAQQAPFEVIPLNANQVGDIGEFLGRVGHDRFYFDLRSPTPEFAAWSKMGYYFPFAGFAVDPKSWLAGVDQVATMLPGQDVMVFTKTVSPSSLWNLPPKK